MKLWSGRFSKNTSHLMDDFHSSIGFDQRLYREDIEGSLDGDDSGLSVSSGGSVALTAQWEEMGFDGNRYGDYPVIYMYITCVIIIALFIAGVALVIYRANQRRDAA